MPRTSWNLSPRVYAIAVVIVVVLATLTWVVNRLGAPAGELPAAREPEPLVALEPAAPGATEGVDAAVPGTEAAESEPGPGLEPQPEPVPSGIATQDITLRLFVAQGGSRELSSQVRRLQAPVTLAAQAQLALRTLAQASQGPLPRGTVIREVWVSPGGVAYVDFAADFPRVLGGGSLAEIHAVYGVVGTLTSSFGSIRRVQFLVDGQPVDTFNGHLDLSRPLGPLRDWIF